MVSSSPMFSLLSQNVGAASVNGPQGSYDPRSQTFYGPNGGRSYKNDEMCITNTKAPMDITGTRADD